MEGDEGAVVLTLLLGDTHLPPWWRGGKGMPPRQQRLRKAGTERGSGEEGLQAHSVRLGAGSLCRFCILSINLKSQQSAHPPGRSTLAGHECSLHGWTWTWTQMGSQW